MGRELSSRPHLAGRGGGGVPWLRPARFPVAAAASLRLLGGRRAAPVFSFSSGMSAACAGLPEEGRKRAGAPRSLAWGLAAPWRGLGSGRQGWARVESPAPKGTPGSHAAAAAAAAEGNRGRAGRGRAGFPELCSADAPASLGRAGAGWGWPPARGLHGGVTKQLFVSPGAACKCVVCVLASAPPAPSPRARFPGPRARPLLEGTPPGLPGEFPEVGGKRVGWGLPALQAPGSTPKLVRQVQHPLHEAPPQPAPALGGGNPSEA